MSNRVDRNPYVDEIFASYYYLLLTGDRGGLPLKQVGRRAMAEIAAAFKAAWERRRAAEPKRPDGPDRVGVFRILGIEFTELTPTEICILDRLWNEGRYGQTPQQDLAKAVQQDPVKRMNPESLKKSIQRLNRKLKKQSDGMVFITSKVGNFWLDTSILGDKTGDRNVR